MIYPYRSITYDSSIEYDCVLTSLGYEHRSSFLVRKGLRGKASIAYAFAENRILSFDDNRKLLLTAEYEIQDPTGESDFGTHIKYELAKYGNEDSLRIGVDISSMTRSRMAKLVSLLTLFSSSRSGQTTVDFFYSLPAYTAPSELPGRALSVGPMSSRFSGVLRPSSIPIGAVIGLGYEARRSIGVSEMLEPNKTWAFQPVSVDERYDVAILETNTQLLSTLNEDSILPYRVSDPGDALYSLDSFVFAKRDLFRLILIPMGPKIFTLMCLFVGLDQSPFRPAVWRVGESVVSEPVDITEDGLIIGLSVEMRTIEKFALG
jgi:hypothetical protein